MTASSPPRALVGILITVFAVYLGWALYVSVTDIPTYNDFEVFHYIGGVAAERQPNIYELKTPHQQRGPFIYPVSASILFIPLSWLPHDVAGVPFSIVKVCCLLLLWWGSARFSGRPPVDMLGWLLVMLGPAIMLHRAVSSDVGNGQVNIILALASAGGIWLMMLSRRWWWLGCVTLAFAIAVKMTPVLLLAIPLLHRRWKALAGCMMLAALLMIALPIAWFGVEGFGSMTRQYREIASRFTFDWTAPSEQTTPTELVQFARLQGGVATAMPVDAPETLPVPISGYAGEQLFEPGFRQPAVRLWFVFGLVAGAAYLALRWAVVRRRAPGAAQDWTWDLAMLCAMIVLLSPRVQKAHLVLLIVPAGWLAARICGWFAPGFVRAGSRRALWGVVAYSIVCALFIIAENLRIPIPGWEQPARSLPLVGLMMLIVMVALVGWHDAAQTRVDTKPKADAAMLHGPPMTIPRLAIALCFAVLLAVPLAFRPLGVQASGPPDALTLIIISPHNEQIRFEFARAFDRWHERNFGRRVHVAYNVPGGTSEIRRMLESQYAAALEAGREPGGDADLVFGGGSFEHARLKRGVRISDLSGRARDEPISQAVDIPEEWLLATYGENTIGGDALYDSDKHWFGVALSGFGIVFNRDALESLGVPEPDAWTDMGDPRLRGWIALVNPGQSGSVASAFESILKREGWSRGWQILRRMAANARYFSGSSLKPPVDVAMGDAAMGVCIDFLGRFQEQALREAGDAHRLGYVDPPGGSTIDPDPISMLRGAPHPELARRFIEFCLTEEGQALWQFAAGADNAASGAMGPVRYELRRLPMRRVMFQKHMPQLIDQVDPYAIATPPQHPDPNFRDFIAPMYAAMAIDSHHQLRDAWNAIVEHPAYPSGSSEIVTAADVDNPDLRSMLTAFDALPIVPGPDRAAFDLSDQASLAVVRAGWLRAGWSGRGLWNAEASPLDAIRKHMAVFFRDRYAAASQRQRVGTPQ